LGEKMTNLSNALIEKYVEEEETRAGGLKEDTLNKLQSTDLRALEVFDDIASQLRLYMEAG
jgi:hypothetical protein